MRRRIKLFRWTDTNFTKLTDERTFNLDMLIGSAINSSPDKEFYEALIAYIFDSVTYFDNFLEIKSMLDDVDEMINNSDVVYNFLEWFIEEDLDQFNKIPTPILYELYKIWHWQNNPKGVPLKIKSFLTRLNQNIEKFGFRISDESLLLSKYDILDFNLNLISEFYFNGSTNGFNKRSSTKYLITNNVITEKDITNFKISDYLSIDELNMKQQIILEYLINQGNTEAIIFKSS